MQILFVLALLAGFLVLRPLPVRLLHASVNEAPHWSSPTVPAGYVIGSLASYWMINRVAGFWA